MMDEAGIEMRLATVYFKPAKNRTDLRPDYFVKDAGTEWIVFPHEICELNDDEIAVKDPVLAGLFKELS